MHKSALHQLSITHNVSCDLFCRVLNSNGSLVSLVAAAAAEESVVNLSPTIE